MSAADAARSRARRRASWSRSAKELASMAELSRRRQIDVIGTLGPDGIARALAKAEPAASAPSEPTLPHLIMPTHHDVRPENIVTRRLHANLAAAADRGPQDFAELLMTPGV